MAGYLKRVGRQIEKAPDAFNCAQKASVPGQSNADDEAGVFVIGPDIDDSCPAIDFNCALVGIILDQFHTGSRPRPEKGHQGLPVEGRTIEQPHHELAPLRWQGGLVAETAQSGWRLSGNCSNSMVELANALESCVQRNLRHGHVGLFNQVSSKMNSMSTRDLYRRHSQVLDEQAPQLPRPDAQSFGKFIDTVTVQSAVPDEPERARDDG
jgi:hypothetical protein